MERKEFLKAAGLMGLTSLLPLGKAQGAVNRMTHARRLAGGGGCVLIPTETAGPYPLDLSGNDSMFRSDITEGNTGTPLRLTLTVVNVNDDCNPIPNARLDIWHCNKDGYYSGYGNQPGYLGTQSHVGKTFFRGIQLTDSNGQAEFLTIYPGWYQGRVTHIHLQVFLSSVLSATSQMAFPDTLNTAVYNTSPYNAHGQNPTNNNNDNVFSDSANTQYQLVDIQEDGNGGYEASLTIGINAPVTGLINIEPETGGQFKLYSNYPNPFSNATTIPFTLTNAARVKIDLYDLQGRHVLQVTDEQMSPGEQRVVLQRNGTGINLPQGSYVYQLSVENSNGLFRQCKLMTIL